MDFSHFFFNKPLRSMLLTSILFTGCATSKPTVINNDVKPEQPTEEQAVSPSPESSIESTQEDPQPTPNTETKVAVEEPPAEEPNQLYVMCNGKRVTLESIVAPVLEKMESVEIPYSQSQVGGDQLRDCSGNFLRVSSWMASLCPEAQEVLAASTGVTNWKSGRKNVFKGTIKSWTEKKGNKDQKYTARTSRSTARWYNFQGLFRPIFADSEKQPITKASKDLIAARNEFLPGTIVWFGKPGSKITRKEGVERMFTQNAEGITHVGVIHSVTKDEEGNVISYKMYHGRRAYKSKSFAKQDNKITTHTWTSKSSTKLPPFGNWTEPVVGIAKIIPPDMDGTKSPPEDNK